jgi:hypothetical protein
MDDLKSELLKAFFPPAPWRRAVGLLALVCLLIGSVNLFEPNVSRQAAKACWDCVGASLVLAWIATHAWWLRLCILLPLCLFYVWATAMAVNFANW